MKSSEKSELVNDCIAHAMPSLPAFERVVKSKEVQKSLNFSQVAVKELPRAQIPIAPKK